MSKRFSLLDDEERHQLLVEFGGERVPSDAPWTLHTLISVQAQRTPEATAIVAGALRLSYRELEERSNRLAHHLIALGVGPEQRVGVHMRRSHSLIVALLGILKAGAAYVPLDPTYPPKRVAFMLADARAPLVIADDELALRIPYAGGTQVVPFSRLERDSADAPTAAPPPRASGDSLIYVIYTSGSTGRPKGVENRHAGLVNLVRWFIREYELTPADRAVEQAAMGFDAFGLETWPPLVAGAEVHLLDEETRLAGPEALLAWMARHRITLGHFPPVLAEPLLEALIPPGLSLRALLTGSDTVQRSPQRELPFRFANHYGPTECSVLASRARLDVDSPGVRPPIGAPLDNVRILLLDAHHELVPLGAIGEIFIAGEGVGRGYAFAPALTAERFLPDPFSEVPGARMYRAGDLGRWRDDGQLLFLGRADHQVKLRGFRIELAEIELALLEEGGLEHAVCVLRDDGPGGKRLVAYLVGAPRGEDAALLVEELRAALRARLPEFMVPSAFVFLDALPLTPNGKVDRDALPAPETRPGEDEFSPPEGEVEAVLAAVWQDVLGIERIGRTANFFTLGGDSILAIQLVARAAARGVRLTPKQIFEAQTIAAQAQIATTASTIAAEQGMISGSSPLTPVQHEFLLRQTTDLHHFNQSLFLRLPARPDPALLERLTAVAERIVAHHDALRLRFFQTDGRWTARFDPPAPAIAVFDLSRRERTLDSVIEEVYRGLDLERGPLFRLAVFDLGDDGGRLLLVAHHLVVDTVSWHILIEDLAAGLDALPLPPKTSSFKQWAERLTAHAASPELLEQLPYWRDHPWERAAPLLVREEVIPTFEFARNLARSLDRDTTRALLRDALDSYRLQINDLLLAALARAFRRWSAGDAPLLVDLEGHGREDLWGDVDLSRTVGWFTSVFPVLLQLPSGGSIADDLRAIKEQLHRIPDRGLGFGVLRFLGDPAVARQLATVPHPEIAFNYLGQIDASASRAAASGLTAAEPSAVPPHSPRSVRFHLLDVGALVQGGQLQLHFTFDARAHHEEEIARLADGWLSELRGLVDHCRSPETGGFSPSDFPLLRGFTQRDIDTIVRRAAPRGGGRGIADVFPLSPLQHGILFHSLYEAGRDPYVLRLSCRLGAGLDVEALTAAFRDLFERHPALRTSFVWEDLPFPVQVVHRAVEIPLTSSGAEDHGLDLRRAPAVRLSLTREVAREGACEGDRYRFVWWSHHVLWDGWSIPLLFQDLFAFYDARRKGEGAPRLPQTTPYREYIAWLAVADTGAAEAFWRTRLAGFAEATPLEDASPKRDGDPGQVIRALPAELSRELAALARRHQLTLSTVLLGAWALVLATYSGRRDVVFGTTVSGRSAPLPGIEGMVGLFINTLPVRVRLDSRASVAAWLQELQADLVELRQHEHTPLVEVQGMSEVPRGQPLFESLFVFENYPVATVVQDSGSRLEISDVQTDDQSSYPLTVSASPGEAVPLRAVYDPRRFSAGWATRVLERFQRAVEALVEGEGQKLGALSLVSPAERRTLLVDFMGPRVSREGPQTLHELVMLQARRTPDAVAVVCGDQRLSYRELEVRANRFAHHLLARGAGPEVRVGVRMRRSPDLVVALLAVLKTGAAYVPIDPTYPADRSDFMLRDARALLLVDEVRDAPSRPETETAPPSRATGDSLVYVVYTSGSTGRPKGVENRHAGLVNLALWFIRQYAISPSDRVVQQAAMGFDAFGLELWPALCAGAQVHFIDDDTRLAPPAQLLAWLAAHAISLAHFPPAIAEPILTAPLPPGLLLRALLTGSDTVQRSLQRELPFLVANHYGPTECAVLASRAELHVDASRPPIGRPFDNVRIYILDPDLNLLPPGVIGELCIAGAGLGRGYAFDPALTALRFRPDPFAHGERLYRTGDLARFRDDGQLEFLGRVDHQVKLRGFRIELGEIESALLDQPAVRDAVCLLRDGRLVAYCVGTADAADLRAALRARLPDFMVPARFVSLDALPLTPNGKLDRKALPDPQPDLLDYLPPQGPVEETLAAVFRDVLRLQRVGRRDDFFSLGGHSLLATQVVSRIRSTLDVALPLRALFEAPTVEALAARLTKAERPAGPPLAPVPRDRPLPLSFAQQRLWFFDQLQPGSSAYNLPVALRLSGPLDVAALDRALQTVIDRHEALRTVFVSGEDGRATQVIRATGATHVPITVEPIPPDAVEARAVEACAAEEAQRPFDLSSGPLLRTRLLRLAEEDHVLLFTMHHIVSDAWSMGVLVRELTALYDAFHRGAPPLLGELPLQYGDYAVWQHALLEGETLERELAFWKRELAGAPPALELPTDRPRPIASMHRGDKVDLLLPPALSRELHALSRAQGVTLFMLLLAAFDVVLARYARQKTVVVGTPIAGRTRAEVENLIGFFVNTLALRADVSGPFVDLLAQIKERTLDAFAHQQLPFDKLVDALEPERNLSRTPIFQILFTLQNAPAADLVLEGISFSFLDGKGHPAVVFDLELTVVPAGDALACSFVFDRDLFDRTSIERLARSFHLLLDAVVRSPEADVDRLPLLDAPDERRLLTEFRGRRVAHPDPDTVHGLVAWRAAQDPDATALVHGSERVTYGELVARSHRLAHHLLTLGVRRESRVGVHMRRSPSLAVALLAILEAGGAYVPLDPTYPAERIAFMLRDAHAPLCITDESTNDSTDNSFPELERAAAGAAAAPPAPRACGDSLAYVVYTSGSTGRPKGCENRHAGVLNFLHAFLREVGLSPRDRVVQQYAMGFDAFGQELWGTLAAGAELHFLDDEIRLASPQVLLAWLAAHRITVAEFPPLIAEPLFAEPLFAEPLFARAVPADLCLRALLTGSDRVTRSPTHRAPFDLVNTYGPTECSIAATAARIEVTPDGAPPPIGRPLDNIDVHLLDEHLQLVPLGAAGELCIAGAGVARGYAGDPSLTAERFLPDPFASSPGTRMYRTGDLARWRPDGQLQFLGRKDHQIKLRGFRVELGEIEAVLREQPAVRDAVCLLRQDETAGPHLTAYLVSRETPATSSELRSALAARLPEFMVPRAFVWLEALPLTPNGKLDRKALPAPDVHDRFVPPQGPTEELVAAMFQEVLGVERVSRLDHFFALGGHSLLATQLVSRIRQTLHRELPLRAIFEAPTVERLAARLSREGAAAIPPLVPAPRDRPLPLSFAQQRLWFLDQLEPGSPLYNLPDALRLSGRLDVAALERALQTVVDRHESLRTVFASAEGGQAVQIVRPTSRISIPVVDADESTLQARVTEEALRPFDLTEGPLLRARLLRLAQEEHVLLFTMHHIVADDWSTGVLVREITALYQAYREGRPSPLPPLPIQYADYAVWQRALLDEATLARVLAFWKGELGDAPPFLDLPADRPRPARPTHRGGMVTVTIDAALTQKLQALAHARGATLFMVLLAAFDVLLSRYARQETVVVGTPIAGRTHAELEDLIGCFVNTLALRADVRGSYLELLEQVKERTLGAFEHQRLPFERLVDVLAPERDLSRSPIFQVLFALQNAPAKDLSLDGLTPASVPVGEEIPVKFELELNVVPTGNTLTGSLLYSRDRFDRPWVERLARSFVLLLEGIARAPETDVGRLPLLDPATERRLLADASGPPLPASGPQTLHALVAAQAARTPDAVALVSGDERLFYGELDARANRIAHRLIALGAGPDVRVGVHMRRSPSMVIALLAILKAGAGYVPLDPTYPPERLAFMMEDARAPLVITDDPHARSALLFSTLEREAAELPASAPPCAATGDSLIYVIYTSGSTGHPKGVENRHAGFVNLVRWFVQELALAAGDRVVEQAAMGFDACAFELWPPLTVGAEVHFMDDDTKLSSAADLMAWLAEHRITVAELPPLLAEPLFDVEPPGDLALRFLLTGSDRVTRSPRRPLPFELINTYGPTECSVIATSTRVPASPEGAPPPIGRPLANVRVHLLDAHLQLVPLGVVGEVFIAGQGVGRGYAFAPALSAERFLPDPFSTEPGARMYRTGDLARYREDGQLQFFGRNDHQVKLRGFRIELGEIESALRAQPGVRDAVCLLRDDAASGPELTAYVIPQEQQPSSHELRQTLGARLPEFMVPGAFVFVEAFPLTPHGKLDRRALPAPAPRERHGELTPPQGPLEETLAAIWQEVLGIERVGRDDDFFALGGHSLLATQVVSRIRRTAGVDLPLRALFEAPTLRRLAARLASTHGDAAPPVVPVPRDRPLPLSFAQQRLWFLGQLEPDSVLYNLPLALCLKGELDVASLERALQAVIDRHEALRTVFPVGPIGPIGDRGRVTQWIHPRGAVRITIPVDEVAAESVEALAAEEASRPFDLARGPLLRARLLRVGPEEHVLLFTMHHIVSDAWSMGVLVREVTALYDAFRHGRPSPLPDLSVQYADHAVWQRSALDEARELAFWRAALAGAPSYLDLPSDLPRHRTPSHRGEAVDLAIPRALAERLQSLARSEGVTLFMLLLAAFDVVLARYARQETVLVGTPIAGRTRVETEELIGFFLNHLVLRADVRGSFRELLAQVKERTLAAFAHQDLPFERLVDALEPERDLSRPPITQVLFSLQNTPAAELTLEGIALTPLGSKEQAGVKLDLELYAVPSGDGIACSFLFDRDLFDRPSIEHLARSFQRLLEGVVQAPQADVHHLPLLDAEERRELLGRFSGARAPHLLAETLHALVARNREGIALVSGDERVSYGELEARANRAARALIALGVRREARVGVLMRRSPSLIVALLAVMKSGGAYVPLDPSYPASRLALMLQDSQARLVLTGDDLSPPADGSTAVRFSSLEREAAGQPSVPLADRASGDSVVYVIYTSGSTGRPKGAENRHRALVNMVTWYLRETGLTRADRMLQQYAMGFDAFGFEVWPALAAGAELHFLDDDTRLASPETLLAWLTARGITMASLVPALAEPLVHAPLPEGLALRGLYVGGDEIRRPPRAPLPFVLANVYGPTETAVAVSSARIADVPDVPEGARVPIGRPLDNVRLYLLDGQLGMVPAGVAGELCIAGEAVGRGYASDPALTAQRFVPDPFAGEPGVRMYRSGDLARLRADGQLEFVGRIDQQVKLHGFRIELGEIESALVELPDVDGAACLLREGRLVAYVLARAGTSPDPEALRALLKQRLPEFMVPATFVFLAELPRSPNGKLDRARLPAPPAPTSAGERRPRVPPRNDTERMVAEIWRAVLAVAEVGIQDNFFELGGDSILSIQVVSALAARGFHVTARHLFQAQTIAELCPLLATAPRVVAEQGKVTGTLPLTPIQHWFFANDVADPHHFNQSIFVQIDRADRPYLEPAFAALVDHHDALRTRFARAAGAWEATISYTTLGPLVTSVDLSRIPAAERHGAVERAANELQASLSLEDGPLLRAATFDLGDAGARLLIVIHHLVVDAVSWRVLLEDLVTVTRQLREGEPPRLPAKTTSFKAWAERLAQYATSPAATGEADYWLDQPWGRARPLATDLAPSSDFAAIHGDSLDAETTTALLRRSLESYRLQINDVLLTALAQAFAQWSGECAVVIDLESHGREELWEDVDLSRTVGWFTTTFPVLLEVPASLDPGASLRSIKERLRAVPRKGIGFGLLRYVAGFPRPKGLSVREHAARLAAIPHPQVIFNYLGQLDAAAAQTGYVAAAEPSGMPISPRGKRFHLIDVVAVVENGQLRVEWMHDRRVHPEARIRELSDAFLTSLRRLVAHCCSADAAGVTPSDFPLVPGLSQEALDGLVAAAGGARRALDLYPLSPLQQGILFHSLHDDPYLQQLTCRLGPDLDVGAFTRAWQSMVERHPILRTSFVWEGFASPLQVVHEDATIPIERHDWRQRAAFDADLAALLREDRARGLDLGKAPAMRLTLIDAPQGYRLIWTFHHILCDGWSSPLLFQELFASYDAHRAGSAPPEHPARPPYRDYIAWLGSRETAASETFWRSRLSDFTEPTLLPVPSGGARGDGPAELTAALPRELSRELAALVRSQQLTANTVLLAAFALVLAAYTGRRDVVFGATVSGRSAPIPGIETMIGLFINTLPVRVRLDPLAKVNDFLAALQADQAEGREHEHTPLVDIHGLSGVPRGQPLFECLFVFENYPASSVAEGSAGSLSIDDVAATDQTNYPLTLSASPGEPLPLRAVYDTRRFSREWMARLLDHLGRAVEAIVHGGERRLGELSLLSDSERRTLLTDFAGRRAPRRPGETVHALIAAQAARTPEATALVAGEERLSYAELDERSNRIARHLLALGVRPETRIGVFMRRSPSLIVVLLGILKSGAAYVPLDPTYPGDRITFMLSDARAPFVIHDDALSLEAPPGTTALPFSSLERTASPDPLPASRASDDSLVYVIYTSGSSGRPKGVENRHAGLVNLIQWFVRQYEIGPRDRFAPQAAVGFDAFALETWPALAAGAELHLLDDDVRMGSPEALLTWLAERQITLIHLPPVLTEPLLDAAHPQGLALRALLTGSDTVQRPPRRSLPFQFANHYGPTECSILATRARVDMDLSGGRPAIGRPLDNVRVYLLDEGLALSPLGGVGELFIGGVGVGRGYAFAPALTAERFLPDPFSPEPGERMYRTGDLARFRDDGQLDFLGREDHQIKLRGFRVELGEVESALLDHPSVKGAACFIAGEGAEGRRLIACVVPEGPFREAEVRGALRARLPDFMLPSAILPLEALPLTPNGKLDRRALVERASDLLADQEEARAIVPPRDDVERGLLECWEELFERRPLSVTDDFFELGGHSLLAVRLLAAIRRRFDYAPSLAEILTRRTVRALAETLRPAPRSRSVLVPLQPRGARPPLYCLHPAGGTVLAYDALARTLGPDQPLFAFEAPGLHGEREPFRRIDELARHLTDVLLAERPDATPFRLAGYSMGGLVALEMGRELRARGREVALVALIDSYLPPEGAVPESDFQLMQTLIGLLDPSGTKFRPPESILHEGTVRERIARIFALAKEAGVAPDVSLDDAELLFRVSAASSAAFCSYRPSPYPGPLVLFRTDGDGDGDGDDDERDGDFGALAQGGLTVVRLDGVHADKHNELLSPAHVGALAAPLGDLLRSLDSSSERRGM